MARTLVNSHQLAPFSGSTAVQIKVDSGLMPGPGSGDAKDASLNLLSGSLTEVGTLYFTNGTTGVAGSIAYDSSRLLSEIGAVPHGEKGYSTLERLWLRPTLDVNGMWGGYTGAGSKTVIANEASAKITMRLVEGQNPVAVQESIMRHLEKNAPTPGTAEFI